MQALDVNYKLHRAQMYGPVSTENNLDIEAVQPKLNMKDGSGVWQVVTSNADGQFVIPSNRENRRQSVYFSFWLYSSRSLSDLLIEPDMPSLDMLLETQNPVYFWLNGKSVNTSTAIGSEVKVPNLLLEKGWNHLILKIDKRNELTRFGVRFHSADNAFMKKMLSSVVK
jgi:beta-galactosidase